MAFFSVHGAVERVFIVGVGKDASTSFRAAVTSCACNGFMVAVLMFFIILTALLRFPPLPEWARSFPGPSDTAMTFPLLCERLSAQ
jgi:hypothetical protein